MKPWLANEQQSIFKQIVNNELPHAIVISGTSGSGKQALSNWLAEALMCQSSDFENNSMFDHDSDSALPCGQCKACNLTRQQTHPDHMRVELQSTSIGVDQLRVVGRFFEKKAQLGRNQVVIIENADKMTESAANALLKTLEEPTAYSFIILLVNDEQRLLPTIISRCRHIAIKPPIGNELLNEIGGKSQDPFINLTHIAELSDDDVYQQYQLVVTQFIHFLYQAKRRMSLCSLLQTHDLSVRWLEKTVVDLLRFRFDWMSIVPIDDIDSVLLKEFVETNSDNLWQVYNTILTFNKKNLTLTQFNSEFGIEKLLTDIQSIMTHKG